MARGIFGQHQAQLRGPRTFFCTELVWGRTDGLKEPCWRGWKLSIALGGWLLFCVVLAFSLQRCHRLARETPSDVIPGWPSWLPVFFRLALRLQLILVLVVTCAALACAWLRRLINGVWGVCVCVCVFKRTNVISQFKLCFFFLLSEKASLLL